MDSLNLTRRQVNYAIGLINHELEDYGIDQIIRHKNGTFTFSKKLNVLLTEEKDLKTSSSYEEEDRQKLILLYLIYYQDYISLDHFTSFLRYSKTTVQSDLKSVQNILKKYSLLLKYSRSKGYYISGFAEDIFRLCTDLIINNRNLLTEEVVQSLPIDESISKNSSLIILDLENHFNAIFSDNFFNSLKYILAAILMNVKQHTFLDKNTDQFIAQTKEYVYLRSVDLLHEYSDKCIEWISLEILSSNLYDKSNTDLGPDEVKILRYIHQMTESFKAQTLVDIEDQDRFEKRLLNHLRPACFRVKYNLFSLGDVLTIEENNNQILMKIISELVHPIEQWIGKKFPKKEIQLLTYYFGYQLTENYDPSSDSKPKYKAIVVCSNGIIMSKILIKDLKSLFPEINFLFTLSAREFEESKEKFDLVFTTIPLKTSILQYRVNPNMSNTQKINLRYQVLNELGFEKTDSQVQEIMNLVSKFQVNGNSEQLKKGIKRVLVEKDIEGNYQSSHKDERDLLSYIKPEYIQIIDKNIEWHIALQTALYPLIVDNKVKPAYYKELVRQIDSPFNYAFLGKYVSIPHATPDKGILDDGISILILKEPIKLPNDKQVKVLAPLALYNMDKYLNAINQLASFSMNNEKIEDFINSNTANEAYEKLKRFVIDEGVKNEN